MRTLVLLIMGSVFCLVGAASGDQHDGSTFSARLLAFESHPDVASDDALTVIGNVPLFLSLQRIATTIPSKGALLQEQTIGSVPVVPTTQASFIERHEAYSDPTRYESHLQLPFSGIRDSLYTFYGFDRLELIAAQDVWVTEALSELTYTGVKMAGPVKEMEYTCLLTETIDKLNPIELRMDGNDLYLKIEPSSRPRT